MKGKNTTANNIMQFPIYSSRNLMLRKKETRLPVQINACIYQIGRVTVVFLQTLCQDV